MEALEVLNNFNSTLGALEDKLSTLHESFDSLETSLNLVGNKAVSASSKLLAFVSITKFMLTSAKAVTAFDDAVARLGSTAGISGKEINLLKQKAIELGSSSSFTAMEVIQAQTVMAKEGMGSCKNPSPKGQALVYP